MKAHISFSMLLLAATMMLTSGQSIADEIRVAVASNFADAIKTIARHFETNTGHKVTLIFGSTGKHYAQIKHGAPFDIFLAADSHRPQLLEKEGATLPGSRFTYAIGKVVLWSPKPGYVDTKANVLKQGLLKQKQFRYLAIANPKLAPYGKAAQEILQARGLWDELHKHLVRGENISQTYQFVKTGNAELGFIAFSQIKHPNQPIIGSIWKVPQTLYTPIKQQAVLLKDNKTAHAFLSFMRSDKALKVIHDFGYDTP